LAYIKLKDVDGSAANSHKPGLNEASELEKATSKDWRTNTYEVVVLTADGLLLALVATETAEHADGGAVHADGDAGSLEADGKESNKGARKDVGEVHRVCLIMG